MACQPLCNADSAVDWIMISCHDSWHACMGNLVFHNRPTPLIAIVA
jgi:hypothetical protein